MNTIYIVFAIAGVVWLFSLAACAVALLCCCLAPSRRRFWIAVVLSGLAILIGYLGTTHFNVTYSRTVNGTGWSVNSRWFFIVPLVLGAVALVLAIWRRPRSAHVAGLTAAAQDAGDARAP